MGGVSGKAVRRAEHPPRKALLMPREGAGLQSFGWRNFAHQAELVGALRSELRGWGGAVRVVPTPGGEVPFCEQLRLWAGADLIVTPNGAHFVNAIFMREGATLIEGVPWAMRSYTGQLTATKYSGLRHVRLHSARPPASPELAAFSSMSEDR